MRRSKLIQLLSYTLKRFLSDDSFQHSTFKAPRSVDDYQINVIDLNDVELWTYDGENYDSINAGSDLRHIVTGIRSSTTNPKVIILLPQNIEMRYHKRSGDYYKKIELKNMLSSMCRILSLFSSDFPKQHLEFSITTTQLCSQEAEASFYFSNSESSSILTISKGSKKATTVKFSDHLIVTTLNLSNRDKLFEFLKFTKVLSDENTEVPNWIGEILILDDVRHEELIRINKNKIEGINKEIEDSMKVLEENNKYKTILYENGEILVGKVYEMLAEMLNNESEKSVDTYDEDFLMRLDDITLIGEVKGISKNVRKENVAQLDTHYQKYMDKLEECEASKKENVKALLIINHQRRINPSERYDIPVDQIDIATRNGSLIIDTYTFLKLYEKYKQKELNSGEILGLLTKSTGLLKFE